MLKKIIVLIFLSTYAFLLCANNKATSGSVIVLDCGSSGTRLHVWTNIGGELKEVVTSKVSPGLSSYVDDDSKKLSPNGVDTDGLKASIVALVANAQPQPSRGLHVYVYATAGMRLIRQNAAEEVMADVKKDLAALQFTNIVESKVISGAMEGYYDWLGLNAAAIIKKDKAANMTGALDLGGGSTEIAFALTNNDYNITSIPFIPFEMKDKTYHIASYSFLGEGQDQARQSIDNDYPNNRASCYPANVWGPEASGPTRPKFNFTNCENNAHHYFVRNDLVKILRPAAEAIVKVPRWSAFSGFSYMAHFFNIKNLAGLNNGNITAVCDVNWATFLRNYPDGGKQSYMQNYCFSAVYSYSLLNDIYQLKAPVTFNQDVDWTEGTALKYFYGKSKDDYHQV